MKTCFKCGVEKPRTEFYRHAQMGDGLLGKCKDCTKFDVRLHRAEHIDRIREYDRQRSTPERLTDARRKCKQRTTPAWRRADRRRVRAHNMAARKLTDPPALCQACGKPAKLERHHHDYDKPLAVMWLCKPCHALADKIRRMAEAF